MTLHQMLPLAAFLLNACLGVLALQRDSRSTVNRVFAAFAATMGVWTFGVFMLRRAPDPDTAFAWQVFIHAGAGFLPALHYHFVAVFLADARFAAPRPPRAPFPLVVPYAGAVVFLILAVSHHPGFLRGVQQLTWGWAPAPGPFYAVFVVWLNAVVVAGLWRLARASRHCASGFVRNRARLIMLGTSVSLAGGAVDFLTFLVAKFVPADERLYPVGILTNVVFSLLVGLSIIRYHLFDVAGAVRRFTVYLLVGTVAASVIAVVMRAAVQGLGARGRDSFWLIVPSAVLLAVLLSPLGRRACELVDRVTFRRSRGCYEALLDLSRHVGAVRAPDQLAAMLVEGIATGVPVTHCALLTAEASATKLTAAREHVIVGPGAGGATLAADGAVARWLLRTGKILVRDGTLLTPTLPKAIAGNAAELRGVHATLIVPLRFDERLVGVLAIGEKLSGEVFDPQELAVLNVVASQAALSLDNARLLRESQERLRRAEALNTELDSFVASTSHDLKAPLVALEGLAGLVLAGEGERLTPDGRRYLQRIQANVHGMARLVADLLVISRVGRDAEPREPVAVDAVVDEVLETMAERLDARGVVVRRTPLGMVSGRPHDIARVFTNLLVNAVTYASDVAAPAIDIGMEPAGPHLAYWIRDNGIGIDPAYHEKVFEMFQRLGDVDAEGNGVGLPIVKKIVQAAGGHVWLESAKGQGTTVRFTWPRAIFPSRERS